MYLKRHLTAASAFWESIGVSVSEQREMAAWAFVEPPVVKTEPGRARLPEDQLRAYNVLTGPGHRAGFCRGHFLEGSLEGRTGRNTVITA